MNSRYALIHEQILGSVNTSGTYYPLVVRKKIADQAIEILEGYDRTRVFTTHNPRMTD